MLNDVVAGIIMVGEAKRQEQIELQRDRRECAEVERRRRLTAATVRTPTGFDGGRG
jgi:hypothetical protein